jgi:hypothetical protein
VDESTSQYTRHSCSDCCGKEPFVEVFLPFSTGCIIFGKVELLQVLSLLQAIELPNFLGIQWF